MQDSDMGVEILFSTEELTEIVEQRFKALVLYAWSRNAESAEDLVQDAFLKLVKQSKRPPNPVAWLCKTITNATINRHRQTERQRKQTESAWQKSDWFVSAIPCWQPK